MTPINIMLGCAAIAIGIAILSIAIHALWVTIEKLARRKK